MIIFLNQKSHIEKCFLWLKAAENLTQSDPWFWVEWLPGTWTLTHKFITPVWFTDKFFSILHLLTLQSKVVFPFKPSFHHFYQVKLNLWMFHTKPINLKNWHHDNKILASHCWWRPLACFPTALTQNNPTETNLFAILFDQ